MIAGRIAAAALMIAGAAAGATAAEPLPSGTSHLSEGLRAQQLDEAANPGMLWVGEGARLWELPQGPAGRSCASHCAPSAEPIVRSAWIVSVFASTFRSIEPGSTPGRSTFTM